MQEREFIIDCENPICKIIEIDGGVIKNGKKNIDR